MSPITSSGSGGVEAGKTAAKSTASLRWLGSHQGAGDHCRQCGRFRAIQRRAIGGARIWQKVTAREESVALAMWRSIASVRRAKQQEASPPDKKYLGLRKAARDDIRRRWSRCKAASLEGLARTAPIAGGQALIDANCCGVWMAWAGAVPPQNCKSNRSSQPLHFPIGIALRTCFLTP